MALNPEEMNRRRERREAQRKRAEQERRRIRRRLILAALILALCGFAIFYIARGARQASDSLQAQNVTQPVTKPAAAKPTEGVSQASTKKQDTKITICAAGDLNVTNAVVQSGLAVNGYDFTDAFMDVAAEMASGDVSVLNLEGNVCGQPYGDLSASAPRELLPALRKMGIDLVQMANSYTVNNGIFGLTQTLSELENAKLEPLGAYASDQDFNSSKGYTMCTVKGLKVAFVAFTKGMGGMGLPAGNEKCVNLLYNDYDSTYKDIDTEGISRILDSVASEKPDLTVALLHWGSENSDKITASQEKIVNLMRKKGVDVILGSHSHLLQKIVFDQKEGTLVAYSLGDFLGNATHAGTNYSIILKVEVTKNGETGETKVTGYSYTPIYTVTSEECVAIRQEGARRVFRIREAMYAFENNYVDKVSQSAYDGMTYALTRIEARITGADEKKDEEKENKKDEKKDEKK